MMVTRNTQCYPLNETGTSVYEMKVHIVSSELYLKLVKECCVQLLLLELPMYPHRVSTNLQGKQWDGGAEVG